MPRAEPAGDGRPGQVHDGVHPVEQPGVGTIGIPAPFVRISCRMAHQPDHPVAASAEKGAKRRPHQPRRARDRHLKAARHRALEGVSPALRGQVAGQLAMAVGEDRGQNTAGDRGLDLVVNPGSALQRCGELVDVAPAQGGGERLRYQLVGEPVRRVVEIGLVLGHPLETARHREHGPSVPQGFRLLLDPDRLPWGSETRDGSGPGVPGEDVPEGGVDGARI